jgi:acyl-CoA thioesterase FadM
MIFMADVTIVCIGEDGRPTRLPAVIRRNLH